MLRIWILLLLSALFSLAVHAQPTYDAWDVRLGLQFNEPVDDLRPVHVSTSYSKRLSRFLYMPTKVELQSGSVDEFRETRLHAESGIGLRLGLTYRWDINAEAGGWLRHTFLHPEFADSYSFSTNGAWVSLGTRYEHGSGWAVGVKAKIHSDLVERGEASFSGNAYYPLTPKWDASASLTYQPRTSDLSDFGTLATVGVRYRLGL